jgi:hypothetical protein
VTGRVLSWAFLVSLAAFAGPVLAQKSPGQGKEPSAETAADAKAPASIIPNEYRMNLMIRTTIVALNQANQTGNYSVLRDLGAPGFQAANTPTRLAELFAELRNRNFDLAPVLFFDPKLVRPAAVQPNGLLRLSGFFPTAPQRVDFDLAFQLVGGSWRLFAIAVDTSPAPDGVEAAKPPVDTAKPAADSKQGAAADTTSKNGSSSAAPAKK